MNLASLLPKELQDLDDPQTALPRIAKDRKLTALIESIIKEVPTHHDLRLGDSRNLQAEGVQLVLTSPPYWTLKEYRKSDGQLVPQITFVSLPRPKFHQILGDLPIFPSRSLGVSRWRPSRDARCRSSGTVWQTYG